MKKKILTTALAVLSSISLLAGCSGSDKGGVDLKATEYDKTSENTDTADTSADENSIPDGAVTEMDDGFYQVEFNTDSSMFHANETDQGKGTLTVKDGKMTLHVRLNSKNITNLYLGTADQAKKDLDNILNPTTETVSYTDGSEEDVYAFDIPIPYVGAEFDLALIGTKEKWYDHKVSVDNPQYLDDSESIE